MRVKECYQTGDKSRAGCIEKIKAYVFDRQAGFNLQGLDFPCTGRTDGNAALHVKRCEKGESCETECKGGNVPDVTIVKGYDASNFGAFEKYSGRAMKDGVNDAAQLAFVKFGYVAEG